MLARRATSRENARFWQRFDWERRFGTVRASSLNVGSSSCSAQLEWRDDGLRE